MPKFKKVIEAIAYALYYQHYDRRFDYDWHVYGTGLLSNVELLGDTHNPQYRRMLVQLQAVPMRTIHPHVFRYSIYDEGGPPRHLQTGILRRFCSSRIRRLPGMSSRLCAIFIGQLNGRVKSRF